MNKQKWMHRGIALALSAAVTTGIMAPPVAEANTERIIGAVIGGAVAANEMNKQIKYYNTTRRGVRHSLRSSKKNTACIIAGI